MDEHPRSKGGIPPLVWGGIVILLIGIIFGANIAPILDPWINPSRAAVAQNQNTLTTQNQKLKEQIDCLVNGIQLNHGKATLSECT